jgi:hypothetical protein
MDHEIESGSCPLLFYDPLKILGLLLSPSSISSVLLTIPTPLASFSQHQLHRSRQEGTRRQEGVRGCHPERHQGRTFLLCPRRRARRRLEDLHSVRRPPPRPSLHFFLFLSFCFLASFTLSPLLTCRRPFDHCIFFHPVCSSISSPPTARPLPSTRTDQRDRRRRSRRLRRSWESTAKPQIPRSSLAGGRRREGRKEEQGKRICINFSLSHVLLSKVQVPLVQVGFALRRVQL